MGPRIQLNHILHSLIFKILPKKLKGSSFKLQLSLPFCLNVQYLYIRCSRMVIVLHCPRCVYWICCVYEYAVTKHQEKFLIHLNVYGKVPTFWSFSPAGGLNEWAVIWEVEKRHHETIFKKNICMLLKAVTQNVFYRPLWNNLKMPESNIIGPLNFLTVS